MIRFHFPASFLTCELSDEAEGEVMCRLYLPSPRLPLRLLPLLLQLLRRQLLLQHLESHISEKEMDMDEKEIKSKLSTFYCFILFSIF